MEHGAPAGGAWNFDAQNRKPLPRELGMKIPNLHTPQTDALTEQVKRTIEQQFPNAPGTFEEFDYPITRSQALSALHDFIENRLALFGSYQDAMSTDNVVLFHSRLSSCLNLHLLTPQEVIEAVIRAYKKHRAPLPSVEGFIRQILGWREYVHGIYWQYMPEYAERNALGADLSVPRYLWTAETDMHCVRSAVQSIQRHAYTHHIQRLMVLGLHCLLLGVHPYRFDEWYMSLFVDAID